MSNSDLDVVHWNVSKTNSPAYGTAKYENHLWRGLRELSAVNDRIQRRDGKIRGSMPVSWLMRFQPGHHNLVHATFQTVSPAAFFHRPKKFVITVHDLAPLVYKSEQRDLSLKLQWKATLPALRAADHLIAISEFTKSEMQRLMGIPESKITVVRQGIDREVYYPRDKHSSREHFGLDHDADYILVVSSNLEHKRTEVIGEILEKLQKNKSNVKVLKAGYGQEISNDQVVNTGWVAEEDMPLLYSAADVYLHPSEYEGFGLPVLEAMSCGTPVVARDVASIPEIVGNTTDLLPADANPRQFAESVLEHLNREYPVEELVERSRAFSWKKTARKTAEVYRDVLR